MLFSFRTIFIILLCLVICNACNKGPDDNSRQQGTIQVKTTPATNVTDSSASSGGDIISSLPVIARGVCWDTVSAPTLADAKTTDGAGEGNFVSALKSLIGGKIYFIKAYATTSAGTTYGNEISISTPMSLSTPMVITSQISGMTFTTATGGGSITVPPLYSVFERGVCYSTSPDPTTSDRKTSDGSGAGLFSSIMPDLLHGYTYHVRAYARTNRGTYYGADITFTMPVNTSPGAVNYLFGANALFDFPISLLARQTDGKIIVAGQFTTINNISHRNIARLNSDGSVDPTFNSGSGFNSTIRCLYIQADGKILVGGEFTNFNGAAAQKLIRLNTDGSKDASFNYSVPNLNWVSSVTCQADGKIMVGDGPALIVRLQPDGSLDPSFSSQVTSFASISGLKVQGDGKIIACGFSYTAGKSVIRFNANGSVDASFNCPISSMSGKINLCLQPDGKLLVIDRSAGIYRLNTDGTMDNSFNTGTGLDNGGAFFCFDLQANGKIVLGGEFNRFNGQSVRNCMRLNSNGSVDGTFSTGNTYELTLHDILCIPGDKILVAGSYYVYPQYYELAQLSGN